MTIVPRIIGILRRFGLAAAVGFLAAVACFIGVNKAAKPFSTPRYCGGSCHEMNTAYTSWELSAHYANNAGVVAGCVDCHLPPKEKFFAHMTAKALAGAKDIFMHHFGGAYDPEKMRRHVLETTPDDRCKQCHANLLGKPGSSAAALAHRSAFLDLREPAAQCVDCHEYLHERKITVYAPNGGKRP